MDLALALARVLLAVVFVVAGVAKLFDLKGARAAMTGFGVPANLAGPAAILLPIAEIAIALLLLPTATAWVGALGALALLLLFCVGIAYSMSQGRAPDCHCFGQLHSEPAGWRTLIRNGLLAGVALFVVLFGNDYFEFSHGSAGASLVGWFGDLTTWEQAATILGALGLVALVALGWTVVHLLSQNGRILLRLDTLEAMAVTGGMPVDSDLQPSAPAAGLPVGSPAPGFKLSGLHGETLTLDALRAAGKPVMLLFSDPGCGPCNALLPDIARWQRDQASKLTLALISRGAVEANRAKASEHGISQMLLQEEREVASQYLAHGTPSAVVVSPEGMIASPLAAGSDAIRQLLNRTAGLPQPTQAVPQIPAPTAPTAPRPAGGNGAQNGSDRNQIGKPAPAVNLKSLDGDEVTLESFRGKKTLVTFWNPGCGFCKRMVDDLKAWEANRPTNAPELLLVSTGSVEANREFGLKSPIVLDEGFTTGRAFGASGTPSAVLVDEQGRIASGVAVGAPGVLALANGQEAPAAPPAPPRPSSPEIGSSAPAVKLRDIDGKSFTLASQKGKATLLVFWNPGCGFCRRMADDLNGWLASKPSDAPQVVLVSTGTAEANRELGVNARTLLDDGFATGRAYGASGTPSAILIDGRGKVASEIAVGAPGVMQLAGAQPGEAKTVAS